MYSGRMLRSFTDTIAEKNKMLLTYRQELDKYEVFKVQLDVARRTYLGLLPGSAEYVNKQQEFFELLNYPIPLPINQHTSNFKIEYEKPKPKPKQKKVKILLPTRKNTNNTKGLNAAAKRRILQEAIQSTFKFKSLEECTSRNKEFFMSKTDLYEAIQNNEVLARHVGKIPKSISKDELCKKLFKNTSP